MGSTFLEAYAEYPEMISQIDKAEPFTQTAYREFHVILTKVFRFDAEDDFATFSERYKAPSGGGENVLTWPVFGRPVLFSRLIA